MEEGLPKVPKLELAQLKFYISKEMISSKPNKTTIASAKEKLLAGIVLDSKITYDLNNHGFAILIFLFLFCSFHKDMTPFYLECCKDLSWPVDQNLVNKMKLANEEKLKVKQKQKNNPINIR